MVNSIKKAACLYAIAAFLATVSAYAIQSGAVTVDADIHSTHWKTVFTNTVDLNLEWNARATSAKLEITGMTSSFSTNFPAVTSNYLWQVFTTTVPVTEDIYDLVLTFYTNGTDVVVETRRAQLAVIKGAFGETDVNTLTSTPKWSKVDGNVVIPYNSSFIASATNAITSQLVITKAGGFTETNTFSDTAGYYGWKLTPSNWGYGDFELVLTFPETTADALTATLTRRMGGTVLIVR